MKAYRVLYFMRSASCAVCRGHLKLLAARQAKLEAHGADVVGIVPEDEQAARDVRQSLQLPFSVVSMAGAHAMVGLQRAVFGAIQQSGTVAVDRDLRIIHVRRSTMPFGALNEAELFAALAQAPAAVAG